MGASLCLDPQRKPQKNFAAEISGYAGEFPPRIHWLAVLWLAMYMYTWCVTRYTVFSASG